MSKLPLSNKQLKTLAPSIFTTEAHHSVSSRYTYISTEAILEVMRNHGWFPVDAFENKVRLEDKKNYQKHLIILQNFSSFLQEKKDVPQLLLSSAHDTSACVELRLGLWRMICKNGLILADSLMQAHKIKHIGFCETDVSRAIEETVNHLPLLEERVNAYKNIQLTSIEKLAFAKAAASLRFDTEAVDVDYNSMLEVRRDGDIGNDLWRVFNRIEESCQRGGIKGKNRITHRNFTSKKIQSIDTGLNLGQKLFGLADRIANIKIQTYQPLQMAA